jgi:hypothetical protein
MPGKPWCRARKGSYPLPEAAERQGCSEEELRGLIDRGLIEAEQRRGVLVARPAIVSILHVRDER